MRRREIFRAIISLPQITLLFFLHIVYNEPKVSLFPQFTQKYTYVVTHLSACNSLSSTLPIGRVKVGNPEQVIIKLLTMHFL